uniref:Gag-asp_proteas domain-containing protein n=1 Tax=Chenopodium quinoa TaxID=63459 RepID=A0A803N8T1_CHEQI
MVAEELVTEAEDDEVPIRVNPLGLLNVVRATTTNPYGGLLYVNVRVNGHDIKAMVDKGATHNFVSEGAAKRLDLPLSICTSRMKAVNSDVLVAKGMVCGVNVQVGSRKGKTDLIAVTLDNFELILGNEFIRKAKASVMPHLGGMLIRDKDGPCFVKGVPNPSHQNRVRHNSEHNLEFFSTLQVRNVVAKGELTFLEALVEISPDKSVEVPDEVAGVLDEFKDVMSPERPKNLPTRRAIDHKIDLEPGALPPAHAPYRMSPGELAELRTQLNDILAAGFI